MSTIFAQRWWAYNCNVLKKYQMIPGMSRPGNPYDNASCESFMKTLKREEIFANKYKDLDHLRMNIEEFIVEYCIRYRLHSELGYRPPEEFEQAKNESNYQRSDIELFRAGKTRFKRI
jgi:putative transposase